MLDYAQEIDGMTVVTDVAYIHPEYLKYQGKWQKARDILEGEDELKSEGKREKYLPRLGGHTYDPQGNADYESFVQYAEFYNATGRTVDAYRGLLNRKEPHVILPREAEDLLKNFTIKGEAMQTFIEQIEVELIATNRVGVFVDYPYVNNGKKLSRYEAKQLNMSPYATLYPTESIINWEERRINNRIVTSLVVLRESELVRRNGLYPEEQITYRILELDEEGYYRQVIVMPENTENNTTLQKKTKQVNVVKEVVYPKQNGKKMTYIPFYPVTVQGVTWELNKSIIEDLINVNISHYRNTALHEKAIMWTASPTAVFSGLPDEQESVRIGSSQAIIIAPGGTAKYLEYEGKGLEDIKDNLLRKEEQMAILGAKILATEHNGVESGEAALIHRAGEQGILADVATTVSGVMEKLIQIICDWRNITYKDSDILVSINKDYMPTIIDANTIIALGQEVNNGRLSYESYVSALQRGEIIPATRSAKEEMGLINKTHEPHIMSNKENIKYVDKKKKSMFEKQKIELQKPEGKEPQDEEVNVNASNEV